MSSLVKTPCIGVCSTGIGDSVCRGCKRFAYEVIGWNGFNDDERGAIMARIQVLITQVVQERIVVFDEQKLNEQIATNKIRVSASANVYCHAYEAIREFGSQLKELSWIGCRALSQWQSLSIADLKKNMDDSVFELSRAHYDRYFQFQISPAPEQID